MFVLDSELNINELAMLALIKASANRPEVLNGWLISVLGSPSNTSATPVPESFASPPTGNMFL